MNRTVITTFEEIHHVCLMYGLKKAFARYPFLVNNIMATPPPVRRNPERTCSLFGFRHNPVNVQYFKKDIFILYDESRTSHDDIQAFAKALVEEYLSLRHPYMKTGWNGTRMEEAVSGHLIVEILFGFPVTDDKQ